ncbi:MAG: hypothetical protein ACI9FB_003159 [Candidatus Azotimanducaceae bacterium]|jgi:hypothetical protein
MLNVHVWPPHGGMVGHASLSFGSNYVSFWPAGSAGKKDLKIKRSQPGHFMAALQEDVQSEGNRRPITVTLPRVNENELSKYIANLMSNTPRYQLARYNCSNIVAECLEVACGVGPSFHPTAHDYGKLGKTLGRGIWTPNEVLRYARELATANKTKS